MNENAYFRLIADNNAHKGSYNRNGKQNKITIAPLDKMSIIEANSIINQMNEIQSSNYSFDEIIKLFHVSKEFPKICKYSTESLNIIIKIFYQDELKKYFDSKLLDKTENNNNIQKNLVILNIGTTSSGKTLGILSSLIPSKYLKSFFPLISMKESTNFFVYYIVNCPDKNLQNKKDFEVEFTIKKNEVLDREISSLILEALQEILDVIKLEIKDNNNSEEVWNIAIKAGYDRLKLNKAKTLDLTNSVMFHEEDLELEVILLQSIKKYITNSLSYDTKLSDEKLKMDIISNIKNNIFKLTIDELSQVIDNMENFKLLKEYINNELQKILLKFAEEYNIININEKSKITIKKNFSDIKTNMLISNIFSDKRKKHNEDFFSIATLISEAKLFFTNNLINNGNQTILVDGLGFNQGQIKAGLETNIVYNRVNASIQKINPDLIIYNSKLDNKDDYIIDVIKNLNNQGYKNRIYITYNKLDSVLENYCYEEDINLESLSEEELSNFIKFINKEYLEKDLISLGNFPKEKVFLCDKTCKLFDINSTMYKNYMPSEVLKNIINIYKVTEKTERIKLNKEKVNKIINVMDKSEIFNNTFNAYKHSIDDLVPMVYQFLRWNTLEYAIEKLYLGEQGYACLYPSIRLRGCFATFLNCDELKAVLNEDYDNIVKELLYQWTNISHILMVTSYKFEFGNLLEMRFYNNLRTMPSLTVTDERKHIIRNILSHCFEGDSINGSIVFRMLTKHVLENIIC